MGRKGKFANVVNTTNVLLHPTSGIELIILYQEVPFKLDFIIWH